MTLLAAARIAMDEQLACGLMQISGGETFAPDFVHHIPPRLTGVTAQSLRDTASGYEGVAQYRVDADIEAPLGTGHAAAFRRERGLEPRLEKAAVPSPYTITMTLARSAHLPQHRDALVEIIQREVDDIVAAGASEVQLDAPVEAIAAIAMEQRGDKNALNNLVDWIIAPLTNVPTHVRRSVHLCLGDVSRQPATERQNLRSLLPLLKRLDGYIDRALIECSHIGQWHEHTLLKDVPDSIEIVAGVADVKQAPQTVDVLREKIDALVRTIGESRLLLSTSCGCARMPHDHAIRLNRNLVKAAAI